MYSCKFGNFELQFLWIRMKCVTGGSVTGGVTRIAVGNGNGEGES